jgi:hypothetical protein
MAMVGRHEVAIISISDGLVVPLRRPVKQQLLCYVLTLGGITDRVLVIIILTPA